MSGKATGRGRKKEKGLATFVRKLVTILDTTPPNLAQWTPDGKAFLVHNPKQFGTDVLAKHFKSGNFSSFIRQLNFYSFHKNVKSEAAWEFSHPSFVRGRFDLMRNIKRKTSSEYHVAYDVELGKLRGVVKEVRENLASVKAQLAAATASIAALQSEKDDALSLLQEANRRLAAHGLPQVDAGLLLRNQQQRKFADVSGRPSKKRRRGTDGLPSATSWGTIDAAGAGEQPQRVRFTATSTQPQEEEGSAGAGAGASAAADAKVPFTFGAPSGGLSPLPDDLFDGLFNMDLDAVGAEETTLGELDLSWLASDTSAQITPAGRPQMYFEDASDASMLPPSLTRSISNLSMGDSTGVMTPRALGSLAPNPAVGLNTGAGVGAGAGAGSRNTISTATAPTTTDFSGGKVDVRARVSELSQEEQQQMAVRLFRVLSDRVALQSVTGTPVATAASDNGSNIVSTAAGTVATTASFAPATAPVTAAVPLTKASMVPPPAPASTLGPVAVAAPAPAATTRLEQQVPPQVLLQYLLQVPAVSMAVLGTSAVVASAAAASAAAATATAAAVQVAKTQSPHHHLVSPLRGVVSQ